MAEVAAFAQAAFQAIVNVGAQVASAVTGGLSQYTSTTTALAATAAATAASAALSNVLSPRPKVGAAPGANNDWRADPNAPVPVIWGRYGTGGYIVLDKKHGQSEQDQSIVSIISLGPVAEIERQWFGREVLVTTNPPRSTGAVPAPYTAGIWTHWQLGATPESLALPRLPATATYPEWTSDHKLSGLAACMSTFRLASKEIQKKGVQKAGWDVKGQLCYDPRKDSTYPGGSGAHRINDSSTWEWSHNAGLCALKYALGTHHNNVLRDGMGAPASLIWIADFVEAANVADANSWTIGGMTTTRDPKWGVLSVLLEACGAKPVIDRGRIGCIVTAPKVSVGTLGVEDIIGSCSFKRGVPLAQRKNTAIPSYNSEPHRWQSVPGTAVAISEFVTADGGQSRMDVPLALVSQAKQAAELAAYRIWETRIALVGTVTVKPKFRKYRIGSCLTVTVPESNVINRKMMIIDSQIDPATMHVTLSLVEEVDAKHASALSKTTTAPPNADFALTGELSSPTAGDWTLTGQHSGTMRWIDVFSAAPSNTAFIDTVTIYYRVSGATDWIVAGEAGVAPPVFLTIAGLLPNTTYQVAASYRSGLRQSDIVILGTVSTHP